MKLLNHWIIVPTTLAMLLTSAGIVRSQTTQIKPGFTPDPLVIPGTSASLACSTSGAKPNHVITLSENFNYLRFRVSSAGQPTLLIVSPSGNSCVQADSFSGGKIEAPGFWEKGPYSLYIGDRTGIQHPYTLSITTQKP